MVDDTIGKNQQEKKKKTYKMIIFLPFSITQNTKHKIHTHGIKRHTVTGGWCLWIRSDSDKTLNVVFL